MLVSPDLADCVQHLRVTLEQSIRNVDALIAVSLDHESATQLREGHTPIPDPMVQVLPLMLQAAGSSSHTLVILSDSPGLHTRDCYSIARSVVELCVNICFIMSEGPPAAERALRHARQKAFRDLQRESQIAGTVIRLEYGGRPDPSTIVELEADIAEFTSRAGRERGWVDSSIDDRIAVAGQQLGDSVLNALHFARFMVYRHSSEVLHGTLFSAAYFFGLTAPSGTPRTQDELSESIGQQHMLILFATVLALSAVIEGFHRRYGFREAHDRSRALIQGLKDIRLFNRSGDETQAG